MYVKCKGYDNRFNSCHTCLKDTSSNQRIKMSQYFPKPFKSFGGNINVKVDLSNYATETDLKNITHIDTSNFKLKQI